MHSLSWRRRRRSDGLRQNICGDGWCGPGQRDLQHRLGVFLGGGGRPNHAGQGQKHGGMHGGRQDKGNSARDQGGLPIRRIYAKHWLHEASMSTVLLKENATKVQAAPVGIGIRQRSKCESDVAQLGWRLRTLAKRVTGHESFDLTTCCRCHVVRGNGCHGG